MVPRRARRAPLRNARQRAFVLGVAVLIGGVALLALWPRDRLPENAPRESPEELPADFDELPKKLSREQVRDALREVIPYVRVCGKGKPGVVRVFLEITGKTGHVKQATVAKQFAGTELAKCAAGVVEHVQFPRFQDEKLTVVFPFTLAATQADGGPDGSRDAGATEARGDP